MHDQQPVLINTISSIAFLKYISCMITWWRRHAACLFPMCIASHHARSTKLLGMQHGMVLIRRGINSMCREDKQWHKVSIKTSNVWSQVNSTWLKSQIVVILLYNDHFYFILFEAFDTISVNCMYIQYVVCDQTLKYHRKEGVSSQKF